MDPADPTVKPFIIYTVVPCPDCGATALSVCLDDGKPVQDDVHLGRYQLFAGARFNWPNMPLKALIALVNGDTQP